MRPVVLRNHHRHSILVEQRILRCGPPLLFPLLLLLALARSIFPSVVVYAVGVVCLRHCPTTATAAVAAIPIHWTVALFVLVTLTAAAVVALLPFSVFTSFRATATTPTTPTSSSSAMVVIDKRQRQTEP